MPARYRGLPLRARLTALYGLAFFVAGGVLVAVMYGIVAVELARQPSLALSVEGPAESPTTTPTTGTLRPPDDQLVRRIRAAEAQRVDETLTRILRQSLVALGLVGLSAALLGYAVASRALRPLTQITETARRVAERSLHERINLSGPADEIKELADTFDEMLGRLDRSFSGQRHFVGNASHELRTPLAVERTLLEVALADPEASEDLKAVGKTLMETNARSERLIEGLLSLARSEQAVTERQATDLKDLVGRALDVCSAELQDSDVTVHRDVQSAPVTGDTELLEQLVLNLVQNAIRHNLPVGGSIWLTSSCDRDASVLEVANTGPAVAEHDLDRMFDPFVRLARERTGTSQGLGLAIVRSVAHSHDGSVTARPREGGGLVVSVHLPRAPDT